MEQNKSSVGSIVGTVIIIALIILGGLYFWGKQVEERELVQSIASQPATTTTTVTEISTTTDATNPVIDASTSVQVQ